MRQVGGWHDTARNTHSTLSWSSLFFSFNCYFSLILYYFIILTPIPVGCDHVIDKSKEDLWKAADSFSAEGYQVVFDANGVETLQESYMHLAPGGKLVVYGIL